LNTVHDLKQYKTTKKKISMVTCYDFWSAQILKETSIDCLLVGDSVSMVVHGFPSTVHATVDMMATHTKAVARAKTGKLIVSDLPFLAHRKGKRELMNAVDKIIKAGAQAIKIETAPKQEDMIKYIIDSGVPVIGHVGLTPQFIHQLGGYKVQGKTDESFKKILDHSRELEKAGCQAIVLECIPNSLAQTLTAELSIPTIGIGAGLNVDGQVLVLQDLLGLTKDFKPRFVRHFAKGESWLKGAINDYSQSVTNLSFPNNEESFL
jgi:3-methyl-2-oxobutanoate hydroxymethyltransferase